MAHILESLLPMEDTWIEFWVPGWQALKSELVPSLTVALFK